MGFFGRTESPIGNNEVEQFAKKRAAMQLAEAARAAAEEADRIVKNKSYLRTSGLPRYASDESTYRLYPGSLDLSYKSPVANKGVETDRRITLHIGSEGSYSAEAREYINGRPKVDEHDRPIAKPVDLSIPEVEQLTQGIAEKGVRRIDLFEVDSPIERASAA